MADKTILVIDDSATIRKLVDTQLSPVGYRVALAPGAQEGLELAAEIKPDLILLDHQLPGTTGYEVCCKLVESEDLQQIPVIVSSTLRKRAYAEYIDLDNVVDMLPKPYTEELLLTTVANALETAHMVVSSQSLGTAVPEVIEEADESALTGCFSRFGLRELLDFLNNSRKTGVLEVEGSRTRIRFHLDRGRIQGVYATGIDGLEIDEMAGHLPQSLANLAPVLRMTIGGRSCAEVDGFVQLLDQKVLDPRLMTKLLRFQAALLIHMAFTKELTSFRFDSGNSSNVLHKNLPLDISLLALLIEGAIHRGVQENIWDDSSLYIRRSIRGQNLDRSGLSARHMKMFNVLSEPKSDHEIASALGWNLEEVRQVLQGFVMAELVEQRRQAVPGQFLVFEPNAVSAQGLRTSLEDSDNRYAGKVVRDKLALQLVLKRSIPHTLFFAGDKDQVCEVMQHLFGGQNSTLEDVRRIVLCGPAEKNIDWTQRLGFQPHDVIIRPCNAETLFQVMDGIFAQQPLHRSSGEGFTAQQADSQRFTDSEQNAGEESFREFPQLDVVGDNSGGFENLGAET